MTCVAPLWLALQTRSVAVCAGVAPTLFVPACVQHCMLCCFSCLGEGVGGARQWLDGVWVVVFPSLLLAGDCAVLWCSGRGFPVEIVTVSCLYALRRCVEEL